MLAPGFVALKLDLKLAWNLTLDGDGLGEEAWLKQSAVECGCVDSKNAGIALLSMVFLNL